MASLVATQQTPVLPFYCQYMLLSLCGQPNLLSVDTPVIGLDGHVLLASNVQAVALNVARVLERNRELLDLLRLDL